MRSLVGRMKPFTATISDAPSLWHRLDSPLGELLLVGDGHALTQLQMSPRDEDLPTGGRHDPEAFGEVEAQLGAYFAGELTEFDLPLAPRGSDFQLRVWSALLRYPLRGDRDLRSDRHGGRAP